MRVKVIKNMYFKGEFLKSGEEISITADDFKNSDNFEKVEKVDEVQEEKPTPKKKG